ncbi:hypothetical protein [Okeania sp. SIO3I5]|nr:hypothetical protein [Okeania sp. SIO3I5]
MLKILVGCILFFRSFENISFGVAIAYLKKIMLFNHNLIKISQ